MSCVLIPIRGEIYWANLEPVEGSEQGGCRPVLIISNTLMNETASVVMVIPMTRKEEKVRVGPFNISIPIKSVVQDANGISDLKDKGHYFAPQDGVLLCNHARTISKNRLIGVVGKCEDKQIIDAIENAIKHAFALEACNECGVPLRPNGLLCARCKRIHRIKCIKCGVVSPNTYKYCPNCGGGL
ncbi:type II toxin-antitoxin system PemK/MazF family toxin [Pelosinus baikalensis]|uniref:Type II toxin-antitoxin system PemK/MazF family toxin n=1 Tax=Pelosinus baikalensis TaxID=2892015 RepID=A0ABS8HWH2_9FIRM|nr:type II toxin-antitoxin system PemK/MazF family toxin [Pelosinus baikalensis]MCC5467508.1 type II toxin-antitoxin system PemK/MazF family toxin [Pelosinus baikalensis]